MTNYAVIIKMANKVFDVAVFLGQSLKVLALL
jgi:hypothetical protein